MDMTASNEVKRRLIERYHRDGPRYTSYPTAPEWREDVGATAVFERLQQLQQNELAKPISLYIHIPFCEEICHFCACNTFKIGDRAFAENYLEKLKQEIALFAQNIREPRETIQMHWGGGTPTYLKENEIDSLFNTISQHFSFARDAEIAIELDPRVTSLGQVQLLAKLGFNRVSFGVQDFDPDVQKACNRIQPRDLTKQLYDQCRQLGMSSINFDLIYGLPQQTEQSFAKTVEEVIHWRPDRIALFSYAHLPRKVAYQRRINAAELPDPASKFNIFVQARERFLESGYVQIGMDHFALQNDELAVALQQKKLRRNFQGYTVKPESYIYAMGLSGISDFGNLYVQNFKKFNLYYDRLDQQRFAAHRGVVLGQDDQVRREVITELMCNFELDMRAIATKHNIVFRDYFATELAELEQQAEDGLLQIQESKLEVLPLGKIFIRNIAMVFDAYLRRSRGERQAMFSKTI